jgi:hypothetical protein
VGLDELAWTVDSIDSLSFGTLQILEQAFLHQHLWKARKILALLLCFLEPLCLCVHHKIHYEFP